MEPVEFDEATHTYTQGGVKLPSVTQVIKAAGLMPDFYGSGNETAMLRGTLVHRICEFHDQSDLKEDSVDPALAGYLEAWKTFRAETEFVPSGIEWRRAHPLYRYAGMVDRIGRFGGLPAIIDIKTGASDPWMGVQLAAYEGLVVQDGPVGVNRRLGVHLTSEGKYSIQRFEDGSDWPIFLSALGLYNWRLSHGRLGD